MKKLSFNRVAQVDFFRYVYIYDYGGFWADMDTYCTQNIDDFVELNSEMVIGYEVNDKNWKKYGFKNEKGFGQYFFGASPQNEILHSIIYTIIRNAENIRFTEDRDILHITGPELFNNIISKHLQKSNKYKIQILNIDQVAPGMPHSDSPLISHSSNECVVHAFMGSWIKNKFNDLHDVQYPKPCVDYKIQRLKTLAMYK